LQAWSLEFKPQPHQKERSGDGEIYSVFLHSAL
jgi:hypothetical protein